MASEGIDIFKKTPGIEVDVITKHTPEELKELVSSYDGLVVRSSSKVTKEILESAEKLTVIGRAGAGVDNIDVPAASNIIDFAMNLTRNSRPETTKSRLVKEYVRWGASPRAGIYLLKAAKAHALLSGRLAVDMEDVSKHVYLVMKHRIILSFKGEMENINKDGIIEEIIKTSY